MRIARITVFVLGAWRALVACSGTSGDAGLFGSDAGLDAAGDSGGSSQTPSTIDSSAGDEPSPTQDAGTTPRPDAGAPDGGATDAQADVDPGIRCFGEPTKYCPLDKTCCVTGAETAGICGDEKACTNAGGVPLPCADARNCEGVAPLDVCCAAWDDVAGRYTSVACKASCAVDGSEHQLCDPASKPDECLKLGLMCKKPAGRTGYAYCQ